MYTYIYIYVYTHTDVLILMIMFIIIIIVVVNIYILMESQSTPRRTECASSIWVFIKGGCSRRGVQWMGVVLYNKTAYDVM